jgi:hypothetical protein
MRSCHHSCFTAFALVGVLTVSSHANAQSDNRDADAKAIRAHIESIFKAFVDKDRAKLRATHGQNWRGFTPWSARPIRGIDGYMNEATFPEGVPKNQGMVGWRISEFDIVFYGDTAVVTFTADLDQRFGQQTARQKINLLDVYHKEPDGWIQVASNTSLHPVELERIGSELRELEKDERASLLAAREQVWRAWFAGDTETLGKLLPPELITIENPAAQFGSRESTLAESRQFNRSGGKLTRLVFPRTELQAYGNTVILYTTFEMDITSQGRMETRRGSAIETFVLQDGRWLNTGWQLATGQ